MRFLTQTFFKGLIALLPVAATVFVLVWVAQLFEHAVEPLIAWSVPARADGGSYYVPGMGLVAAVVLIFLVGLLVNAWFVRQFLAAIESLLERVPLAKTVMGSVRDMMGFFAPGGKKQIGRVVIVTLAPTQAQLVGFVTRDDLGDLPADLGDADKIAVYLPMSYQLGGFTALVPRSMVRPVDMRMEEAMRFVLTAGVKSEEPRPAPQVKS